MKRFVHRILLLLGCCFWMQPIDAIAQCTNKVSHISGSAVVGGSNVTVTSVGNTCGWTSYCFGITDPYFIGYAPGPGSGSGAFTFTFSPAINGITLNFSGASSSAPSIEQIRLAINGAHYPMASVGVPNGCDPMAILTAAGDLEGCPGCGVSGWSGTTISGFPITTLTVEDYVLGGSPNGSLFSLWICPAILPAEWLDFSATLRDARTVDLEWATQTEINNDFFTVERSGDGQQWVALTQVDGAGNSDTERDYAFTDAAPLVGENHYRIRETSLDGTSTFSEVKTVSILASDAIRIHPNPAQDVVTIQVLQADAAQVILRNQLGQTVSVPLTVDLDAIQLQTSALPRGVYFLEVKRGAQVFAQKLVLE